jgi:hypothetical protein
MLTNSILADKLNIPLSKIRRWARELLPPDSRAGRRTGYTREYSNNDGFFIYIGGVMVTDLEFTFERVRETIEIIKPWLFNNGLVPDIPESAKRRGIDEKVSEYTLYFDYGMSEGSLGVDCYVRGIIGQSIAEKESRDQMGKLLFNYSEIVEKRITYWLCHYKLNIPFNFKIFSERLFISFMLKYFIMSVFGLDDYNLWLDKWEKLCETPKPKAIGKES